MDNKMSLADKMMGLEIMVYHRFGVSMASLHAAHVEQKLSGGWTPEEYCEYMIKDGYRETREYQQAQLRIKKEREKNQIKEILKKGDKEDEVKKKPTVKKLANNGIEVEF